MLGIYVHFPFCEKKCLYCAFSSFVCENVEKNKYIDYLIQEIKGFSIKHGQNRKVDTIYFGGGTPSLIDVSLLKKVVNAIKENFEIEKDYEFTIECNPNSLTEEKLIAYKNMGINRISLGVQSLDDDALKFIGRVHDKRTAIKAIENSKKYFDNVSCDLLIGLRNIDKESFLYQLDILNRLGVRHISSYMLQVEEGTPLKKMLETNPDLLPDDEECVEIYQASAEYLKKIGFDRYEVSNFAQKGYESRHNLKYWSGEEYIGFGLGAHSFLCDERFASADNFNDYYSGKLKFKEMLIDSEKIEEHIMLGLRCKIGINKNFLLKLGYDITQNFNYEEFLKRGVLKEEQDKIYLDPSYYGVNNYVIASLLP